MSSTEDIHETGEPESTVEESVKSLADGSEEEEYGEERKFRISTQRVSYSGDEAKSTIVENAGEPEEVIETEEIVVAPELEDETSEEPLTPQEGMVVSTGRLQPRKRRIALVQERVKDISSDLKKTKKDIEYSMLRLERQIGSLRSEISSLKSFVSREYRQETERRKKAYTSIITKRSKPRGIKQKKSKKVSSAQC